uniref:Uncharacterized protein n=1 Tax=Anguilla anguilla TaxID=7936 RepID=A0A0E9UJM8_ANGAN
MMKRKGNKLKQRFYGPHFYIILSSVKLASFYDEEK